MRENSLAKWVPTGVIALAWGALGLIQWRLWTMLHPSAAPAVVAGANAVFTTRPALWLLFTGIIWLAARQLDLRRPPRIAKLILHGLLALTLAALDAAWYQFAWSAFGEELLDIPFLGYYGSLVNGSLYLYAIVLGCTYGAEWYTHLTAQNLRKAKLRSALTAAQLHALTVQLHPHFLFNALNSVSELVHRTPAIASAMILHLRELLKQSMITAPRGLVPLHDELAFLQHYLELQRARFSGLMVEVNSQPEALAAAVPHFLLQPLVENAIRHGITPAGGAGAIAINAEIANDKLRITVTDDGVGLRNGDFTEGFGLRNVRERIEQLFPTEGRFTLTRAPGGGALACVEFPAAEFDFRPEAGEPSAEPGAAPADLPANPDLWRIAFTTAAVLFAVSVVKELAIFGITAQPWTVARHWLIVDLFGAFAWAPTGVLVAYVAYHVVTSERKWPWTLGLVALLGLLPLILLLIRAQFRLVYMSSYQLWSLRSVQWVVQDLAVFLAVATLAFIGGIYRNWRETELSAAELFEELSQSRVSMFSRRVHPELLTMLERLAHVSERDSERTDYLTGKMGELLRYMLEHGAHTEIPLAEEMAFLETLLEIEAGLELRPSVELEASSNAIRLTVAPRSVQRALNAFEADTGTYARRVSVAAQGADLLAVFSDDQVTRRTMLETDGRGPAPS